MRSGRTVPALSTVIDVVPGRLITVTLDGTGDRHARVKIEGSSIFGEIAYDELLVMVGFCQRHIQGGKVGEVGGVGEG